MKNPRDTRIKTALEWVRKERSRTGILDYDGSAVTRTVPPQAAAGNRRSTRKV